MTGQRGYGEGTVRVLKSGRYQAQVRFQGKRVPAPHTFDTRGDANAWITQAQRQIAKGTFQPPERKSAKPAPVPADRRTLKDHAESWLAGRPDLKPRTRHEYRALLDLHILPALGAEPVADLAPERIRAWYAACSPGKIATRTKCYSLLKSVLAQLEDDEVIPRNPCRIKGAGTAPVAKVARVLTPEEIAALATAMPEHLRLAVMLAGYGGLRLGEVLGLQRRDVDAAGRTLTVCRTSVTLPGGSTPGTPKSRAGRRTVSIPAALWPAIEAHLAEHAGDAPDAWLFAARQDPKRPMGHSTFYKAWQPARVKVGLPGLPFHDVRHSHATLYARAGANLPDVMARLGHATPAMAAHYLHSDAQRDAAITADLPVVLPGNVVPLKPKRRTKGKSA